MKETKYQVVESRFEEPSEEWINIECDRGIVYAWWFSKKADAEKYVEEEKRKGYNVMIFKRVFEISETLYQLKKLSKKGEEKHVGWWQGVDHRPEIELVRINGGIYALYGWNGEEWTDCWRVSQRDHWKVMEDDIEIKPIYAGDLLPGFWETHPEEDGSKEWDEAVQIADYEIW